MVSMLMMQSMAIHPGDRTYIDPKDAIHDRDGFDEPLLIVQRTMSDTQMKNVGQIQPAEKPAKDQISSADQRSSPGSPISRRETRTAQQVENNNRIAC